MGGSDELTDELLDAIHSLLKSSGNGADGLRRELESLDRDDHNSLDVLRRALEVAQPTNKLSVWANCALVLARELRHAGDDANARDILRRAADVAYQAGDTELAGECLKALAEAGGRPRKLPTTGLSSLTAAEKKVAELAAQGKSNKQIAETLFLSQRTVESHLAAAFKRLGCSSRSELVDRMHRTD